MSAPDDFEATWLEGEDPAKVNPADEMAASRQADEAAQMADFTRAFDDQPEKEEAK